MVKKNTFVIKPLKDDFEPPRKAPNGFPPIGAGTYISALLVGAMKSGKSTAMLNLLQAYDSTHSFDHIYYISRTVEEDKKVLNMLNTLNASFSTHDDKADLGEIIEEIKEKNSDYEKWLLYKKAWEVFLRTHDDNIDKIPEKYLLLLEENNFTEPDWTLYPHGMPIHTIVLDDLLGSGMLSTRNSSPLNKLISIHRHHHVNIFICLQAFSQSLSPALRSALNLYCLWSCKSKKIQMSMASSLAGYISPEDFVKLWEKATEESRHDFLCVNLNAKEIFTKNFSIPLTNDNS